MISGRLDGSAMKLLKGHLLISVPVIPDDDFAETVILLVEHAEDGAYGLTLNQPTDLTVEEAWAQNNETPCRIEGLVHAGGPCGEFLTALHTHQGMSNIEVAPGLHYTQAPGKLAQLVGQQVDPIKFFAGFAGWAEGQLETESEDGSWLTLPAMPELVFAYGDDLWLKLAGQILGEKTLSALKIKHRP
jgi:putative transcriptional regulator